MYTLNEQSSWYVNYISIKLFKKKKKLQVTIPDFLADGGKPLLPPPAPPPGLPPPTPEPPGEPVFLLSKLLKKFARTPSLVAPAIKKKDKIKNLYSKHSTFL